MFCGKNQKKCGFIHPIDTVVHWYEEVQTIPAQLKKNFEAEKEKAHQNIKLLTAELKKAKALHQKAKTLKAQAVKKAKKLSFLLQLPCGESQLAIRCRGQWR